MLRNAIIDVFQAINCIEISLQYSLRGSSNILVNKESCQSYVTSFSGYYVMQDKM